jgi:hypothetical protein
MVVELEENHGALNAVVEHIIVAKPTNPAKVRLVQMSAHFGQTVLERLLGEQILEAFDDFPQKRLLGVGQLTASEALVWDLPVVLVCACEVALVGGVVSPLGEELAVHLRIE